MNLKTYLFSCLLLVIVIKSNAQKTIEKKEGITTIILNHTSPIFPGCKSISDVSLRKCFNAKIAEHIAKEFKYPKKAKKQKLEDKVIVLFTVNKEGNIIINKVRAKHKIFKKEAIRIFKSLPKVIPGKLKGKPIDLDFAYPLNFKLQ